MIMDMADDCPDPKRGDIVQSNVGTPKERTWLVVYAVPRRTKARRFKVHAVRWWDLEPRFRQKLAQSAERAGGQNVIIFQHNPAKKRKMTFEEYMRR